MIVRKSRKQLDYLRKYIAGGSVVSRRSDRGQIEDPSNSWWNLDTKFEDFFFQKFSKQTKDKNPDGMAQKLSAQKSYKSNL